MAREISDDCLLNILADSIGGNMPFAAFHESSTRVRAFGACRVSDAHKTPLETTMAR